MAISLRLRPTEAKQTKIGGLGTKMSKPGLYREASHSGSWYSASGNCHCSSLACVMLAAGIVLLSSLFCGRRDVVLMSWAVAHGAVFVLQTAAWQDHYFRGDAEMSAEL